MASQTFRVEDGGSAERSGPRALGEGVLVREEEEQPWLVLHGSESREVGHFFDQSEQGERNADLARRRRVRTIVCMTRKTTSFCVGYTSLQLVGSKA